MRESIPQPDHSPPSVMAEPARPPRRRARERNDARILQAARDVFVRDAHAPIAEAAARAGIGISALYRRFPNKDALLRHLCRHGLDVYLAAVTAALADPASVADNVARFMTAVVAADTHPLTWRLAGTFPATPDLYADGARGRALSEELLGRAQDTGAVRPDVTWGDVILIFEQLAALRGPDDARTAALRQRALAIHLASLRPGGPVLPATPLTWQEFEQRWQGAASDEGSPTGARRRRISPSARTIVRPIDGPARPVWPRRLARQLRQGCGGRGNQGRGQRER